MKLIISDIKSDLFEDSSLLSDINNIIKNKLNKNNIAYKGSLDSNHRCIRFVNVDDNKNKNRLFISNITNKILLKNEELIKTKGRSFLNSQRVTEAQYNKIIDSITGTLDRLKIKCDIKLYEYDNDENSFIKLREGFTNYEWPKPTSFPVKGE